MHARYFVGVDLGAGSGAKLGLFDTELNLIGEGILPISGITGFEELSNKLKKAIESLNPHACSKHEFIASVGLASPGLFASDGTYIIAANLGFLNGRNLRQELSDKLYVPVGIVNDADAGGLAAWHMKQEELLYWVFGGGWGGAWISADGKVIHPAVDWDRKDSSLHPTNEPGYAVPIPLERVKYFLDSLTMDSNSFSRDTYKVFIENLIKEFNGMPLEPSDDDKSLRAEALVSGTGMLRLFKALTHHVSHYYRDVLTGKDAEGKDIDPGRRIDELAKQHNIYALKTHELFGSFLGIAGAQILDAVAAETKEVIPVYLAGKPSKAYPYFIESALDQIIINGHRNKIMPIDATGKLGNPNLIGAAVKAKQVYEE